MTTSTTLSPKETKNLDIYGDAPLEWERIVGALDRIRDLEVADSASHYWIGTTRPDGRHWTLGEHLDGVALQQWRSMVRDPVKRARRRITKK